MNFDGDDELTRLLAQAAPRGASPELRREVLDAVGRELAAGNVRGVTSWLAWGVAALVLLAIGLNVAVSVNEEQRMARLRHHQPARADVAELTETVASFTDDASAEAFRDYVASVLSRRAAPAKSWPEHELRAIGSAVLGE
jgi:hypothetical protein